MQCGSPSARDTSAATPCAQHTHVCAPTGHRRTLPLSRCSTHAQGGTPPPRPWRSVPAAMPATAALLVTRRRECLTISTTTQRPSLLLLACGGALAAYCAVFLAIAVPTSRKSGYGWGGVYAAAAWLALLTLFCVWLLLTSALARAALRVTPRQWRASQGRRRLGGLALTWRGEAGPTEDLAGAQVRCGSKCPWLPAQTSSPGRRAKTPAQHKMRPPRAGGDRL